MPFATVPPTPITQGKLIHFGHTFFLFFSSYFFFVVCESGLYYFILLYSPCLFFFVWACLSFGFSLLSNGFYRTLGYGSSWQGFFSSTNENTLHLKMRNPVMLLICVRLFLSLSIGFALQCNALSI